MKRVNFFGAVRASLVAATLVIGLAGTAAAEPIVEIIPVTQDRSIGDFFTVFINVRQVTEPIGGLDIDLDFDETILAGQSWAFGAAFGAGFDGSFGFSGGTLNLYFASFSSIPDLTAAQGAAFTMATLTFQALTDGVSPLTLSRVALSDGAGESLLVNTAASGSVCVGAACGATSVPEPTTLLLLGSGLLASSLVARRRRQAPRA